MRTRRDLIRREAKRGLAIPAWLERLASVGIVTADAELARRQRFTNIAAYATAANALSHLVINSIYDFDGLVVVHIYNIVIATLALGITRLHRFGPNLVAMALVSLIIVGNLLVVWLFGSESTLHVYFTLAGAMLFMFGVERWRMFLVWFALICTALLVSIHLAPEHGIVMEHDIYLRQMLSSHAMINAIAINALLIFYALAALRRAEIDLGNEHARSEALVEAVMPPAIAERLKAGETHIADRIDILSVLFADLVDFTQAARGLPPEDVVLFLDRLVTRFDSLCAELGVQKIKTIGDCYMAAAGFDGRAGEAARAVGLLALAMGEAIKTQAPLGSRVLDMRIGVHAGPATAGIIGDVRFSYDVWGDAVNVASRMESHGVPGRILASEAFRALTDHGFVFEERGAAEIKGLGVTRTFFLLGEKA